MQRVRKWLFKATRIITQIRQFSLTQRSRRFSLLGFNCFASEIPSLLKDNMEVLWHLSYFGQQSDYSRRIAKIGKENVGRILPQLVYGVLT